MENTTEEWRPTIHRPKYEVSSFGRVRKDGKLLKINADHYPRIRLGRMALFYVHRLIAEAFLPNPENKTQVNHKDGNRFNNSIDNLEWVTPSENGKHAYRIGLNPSRKGKPNKRTLTSKNK